MVSLVYPPASMPLPPTRPAAGLKRDSSHLSSPSSHDSVLASQNKRLKVAFDESIDMRIIDDWNSKPLDLVREEVRAALDGHLRPGENKDDTAYEQVCMLFAHAVVNKTEADRAVHRGEKPSNVLLKKYIIALLGRVSELKGCGRLVFTILDINWFGRDDTFVALYVRFLGALGSAMPGFLKAIMERVVRHFTELPSSFGRLAGEPIVGKHQMLGRLHNVLRYLVRLIPSGSAALGEVFRILFPNHRTTPHRQYLAYVKNMFQSLDYAPELNGDVLALTTERLVKIDVEIQEEIDELDDEDEEDIMNVEPVDDLSDDSDAESDTSTELSISPEEQQLKALRDSVAKMDSVLDILFAYWTMVLDSPDRLQLQGQDKMGQMISQFCAFVLPTYRSRHTQFLAFHFAQMDRGVMDTFLTTCVNLAVRGKAPSNGSISASAYLASFVARGARVGKNVVRRIVNVMCEHLDKLRRSYENTCRGPDLSRYSSFYATTQALLYIFCFRWRDLVVSADDSELDDYDIFASGEPTWIPGFKEHLTQTIYCRLNPLKVCSPTIVSQFAAIANHLRFMFVYPLLETNKRLRLSSYRSMAGSGALSAKAGEDHHQLDAFFPFDPYNLRRSKRWLEGDYNEWKGIPGMKVDIEEEEDDGSDSESDEDEEDQEDDLGSESS